MTKVAVVILNWNGIKFLEKFLPTLVKETSLPDSSIIIADNASTDNSITFLKEEYPSIDVIQLEKNYGFAEGYNRALMEIEAKYFMIINSDIEVTQNWIEPLVDFLDNYDQFAACSPLLLDYKNKTKFEYAGAAGGFIDKYGYTFCRGRLFNTVESANVIPEKPLEVFWTTGACMLIRSSLFKKNNGFDAHFFAHMEEVDLCWRLKNCGEKFAVIPQSAVYHVGGGTLPKNNPFKTYLNFRNNLFLLYKNLPDEKLKHTIRSRMHLDRLSALMFLITFQWKDFRAVIKAHKAFLKHKSRYHILRKEQTNHPGVLSHKEIYEKSVVFDYFFTGRKKFNQLRDGFPDRMNMQFASANEKN